MGLRELEELHYSLLAQNSGLAGRRLYIDFPKMTRTEMLTFNLTSETDEKIRLRKFINNVVYCKMSRSIFGLLLNVESFCRAPDGRSVNV